MVKKKTLKNLLIIISIASLFLLDILTKFIFTEKSFFEDSFVFINYTKNYGSSFGIFSSVEFYPALLTALSIIAIITMIVYYKKIANEKHNLYFFIFLLAGLLGNTFDRTVFGYVRDFIALKYFFIFNLADLYITIAFIILVTSEVFNKKTSKQNK